jgi:hypothetical protein
MVDGRASGRFVNNFFFQRKSLIDRSLMELESMVHIVLSCRSRVEIYPHGLEKINGSMNHISPDLRSMNQI